MFEQSKLPNYSDLRSGIKFFFVLYTHNAMKTMMFRSGLTGLLLIAVVMVVAMTSQATAAAIFSADAALESGDWNRDIVIRRPDGRRVFDLYIPEQLQVAPYLVIDMHSADAGRGGQQMFTKLDDLADEFQNFIIASPEASFIDGAFNAGYEPNNGVDDVGFLIDIINKVKEMIVIDPRRVYAMGYSNGGGMAQNFAYKASNQVAAIATNSKALYNPFRKILEEQSGPLPRPIPVININGKNDQIECWSYICLLALPAALVIGQWPPDVNGQAGWRNWAELNNCTGDPVTLAEGDWFSAWFEENENGGLLWEMAFQDCQSGVEVVQIFNTRNHGGEWFGRNGLSNQFDYSRRILEFLFRWTIPSDAFIYEPQWWSQARSHQAHST